MRFIQTSSESSHSFTALRRLRDGAVARMSVRPNTPLQLTAARLGGAAVALARNLGFSARELRRIEQLIEEHEAALIESLE